MNPTFRAEIRLLATQEGGRRGPLVSGEWRTVLGVGGDSDWSARLLFTGSPAPGDTFEADVQMLVPEAYEHFAKGVEFTVWESGTKGVGRVLTDAA
jgi:hypothetical protein